MAVVVVMARLASGRVRPECSPEATQDSPERWELATLACSGSAKLAKCSWETPENRRQEGTVGWNSLECREQ